MLMSMGDSEYHGVDGGDDDGGDDDDDDGCA